MAAIRDFGYEYVFEGIKESPNRYDYRNKMEFSFGDEVKDGPLALGMHKRGSFYDIVTVDGCRLTDGVSVRSCGQRLIILQSWEPRFIENCSIRDIFVIC